MKRIRILIADDHSVVREGLRALFQRVPDFNVIAEAADGEEVLRLVTDLKPDVAVVDISMPKVNGIEVTRRVRRTSPETKVLILTIHQDEEYVYQLFAAGANGYVVKDAGKEDLFAAVRSVFAGDRFFSPGISKMIIEDFIRRAQTPRASAPSADRMLTRREAEVLRHIAQGMTNAEIASKLFLSIRTINTHRSNLMHKLDIHNTAGLVRYAVEYGVLDTHR